MRPLPKARNITPIWSGYYLGLPFCCKGRDRSGIDDWGLVRLVSDEQFSRALPSMQKKSSYDILLELQRNIGRCVGPQDGQLGDIVVIKSSKWEVSFGLCLGHGKMLIARRFHESSIIDYTVDYWAKDIVGIYRYVTAQEMYA